MVVLKNCEPKLSYTLADLFNKCLQIQLKTTYHPISLPSVVNKVFEKPVNNRIVDHLEKCDLFADFQYGFISSRSTANLLTVVCNRIASVFNRSGATRAVAQGLA